MSIEYFCIAIEKVIRLLEMLVICFSFSIWDTVVDGQEAENCYRHLLEQNETTVWPDASKKLLIVRLVMSWIWKVGKDLVEH